jgi:uncharacterized membrane protein
MTKGRVEAFSDGVIAILITIMVLELKVPEHAEWNALRPLIPVLLSYVLSFVFLGIYWNNHHHMFHLVKHVTGGMLWANLHLLFWLSLVPFVTGWMGENHFEALPTAVYGVVLLCSAGAWTILQIVIVRSQGPGSVLGEALGSDVKGKASAILYLVAIPLAFVNRSIAYAIYVLVALIWLVPDRRMESRARHAEASSASLHDHKWDA